jgi:hypothetical protein
MIINVGGIKEVQAALDGLTFRKRQNIERKAARAAMNILKKRVQAAWRSVPVSEPSVPSRNSIRKAAAKATTVKVGTRRGARPGAYARLFLNYHKKKAGRARLAHLLEWPHKVYRGGSAPWDIDHAKRARKMIGASRTTGKFVVTNEYTQSKNTIRDKYMRAVLLWVTNPKMTQKQARGVL